MSKIKDLMIDTLASIDSDRKHAEDLLKDAAVELGKSVDKYRDIGPVAAKFLEALQRSNEQRIKLIGILAKKIDEDEFGDVSGEEATELYEEFEEEDSKDGS